jgi:hypothetical protein
MKKALLSLVATGVAAGGVGLAAHPAAAATSPTAVCGSGYSVGVSTRTGAYLQMSGKDPITDVSSYAYYAGPVSASAVGKCVIWGGGTNNQWWYSGWSHCG